MTILTTAAVIWLGSVLAGLLGALTGLGGGVVIVPMLTLGFGVDLHYAIGVSLLAIIATSSGAAAAYVREGYTNVRLAMILEVATTFGALCGAYLSGLLPSSFIGGTFGAVLLLSAYLAIRKRHDEDFTGEPDRWSQKLKLAGTYPSDSGAKSYNVTGVPAGFSIMYVAGLLSALLGIGSGSIKVLAMDQLMKIPFKVSTTTSNFMIGVTAAASTGVYLARGYIDPMLAVPVTLGVLLGSIVGARILMVTKTGTLRIIFAAAISVIGVQMMYKGLTGGF